MPPLLSFTDSQLQALLTVAALVVHADRDKWLRCVASKLTAEPTDTALHAALLGTNNMTTKEIIHRLRLRAHQAQAEGRHHEARDLRLALDALVRLSRDAELFAPRQREQAKAG
ncbi:MAG: hypothetical protein ACLP19_16075 [Xanthobacteraceae bacterium]